MARYYGLKARDVDELTIDEFEAYATGIDQALAKQQTGGD